MKLFLATVCLFVVGFAQENVTETEAPTTTVTTPLSTVTDSSNATTAVPEGYCMNGGQVQCLCDPNFFGDRCENAVNPCVIEVVNPDGSSSEVPLCGDHGTCQFADNHASCKCDDGWSGAYCQIADGNSVTISLRCLHTGFGGHNGTCSEEKGERCLPDNLNCLTHMVGSTQCPDNIGWCLPRVAAFKIAESYIQLYNKSRRPLSRIQNPMRID